MSKRYNNELKILLINLKEKKEKITSFIKDKNYSSTVLLDIEGEVAKKYSVFGIPFSFILDKQGKVVLMSPGYVHWNSSKMRSIVDDLISEE